jgi:glucose-1-phosphate adenylyltransferase
MGETATVIMGGGQGQRLFPLTRDRAKPAVPFAGRVRLIDIPLSNCINSNLTRIYVLTQFNSASLNRHINRTYNFGSLLQTGVEVLAAELTAEHKDWFQGTADAVRRNLRHVLDRHTDRVLILAGDHLYKMDYRPFLQRHEESGADITIAVCPVSDEFASSFGLLHCDDEGLVTRFAEKPQGEALEQMRVDPDAPLLGGERSGAPFLASMGIYVFKPEILLELLEHNPDANDFGREILPTALGSHRLAAHLFRGYWEDIGTIHSFYRANLALATEGQYPLYDPDFPLYTRPRYLSPTLIGLARIEDSLIAEGSVLGRASIKNSIIGIRSRIGNDSSLDGVLLMGNDRYETDQMRMAAEAKGLPAQGIGADTVIERAIVDKNARVGRGVRLTNRKGHVNWDGEDLYVRDGIVVVPRHAVVADGTEF